MPRHRIYIALTAVIAFFMVGAFPLQAQSPAVQLWHIPFRDQAELNRLATTFDLWEVDHTTGRALALLTADEAAALRQTHDITLAPDQTPLDPPVRSASQPNGIPGFTCYRTVDETFATHEQLVASYPELVQEIDIGDSWDKIDASSPSGDVPTTSTR